MGQHMRLLDVGDPNSVPSTVLSPLVAVPVVLADYFGPEVSGAVAGADHIMLDKFIAVDLIMGCLRLIAADLMMLGHIAEEAHVVLAAHRHLPLHPRHRTPIQRMNTTTIITDSEVAG